MMRLCSLPVPLSYDSRLSLLKFFFYLTIVFTGTSTTTVATTFIFPISLFDYVARSLPP